jgi:lipopolysaccharide biosynthesis protein
MSHRIISIHLPQFHPIKENDEWWGKGFTEWTNVTKANPIFKGHYQPHLPTDLGFYDLRLEQARAEQAKLAKEYGIHGFCYYHYWFNGKRLLHEPVDAILEAGKPEFPFMLCWANENWTRRWDGSEDKSLIKQHYSEDDDIAHIQFLCKNIFNDPRYIRVNGKPFFAIYRPKLFPNINRTLQTWRNQAMQLGIGELYLGYMQGFNLKEDPATMGFDVAIDFQPDFYNCPPAAKGSIIEQAMHKLKIKSSVNQIHNIISYPQYVERAKNIGRPNYKQYPGITPMWDNTARRKKGATIFKDASPQVYESWLKHIIKNFQPYSKEENFIFVNAWNEWAEGNHLEPCAKWGRQYLEATKRSLESE